MEYLKTLLTFDTFILFSLTTVSSLLGNLKNILLVKDTSYRKYLLVLLDTVLFALIVKSISSPKPDTLVVFALGKLFGLFLTDVTTNILDNSVYLANIYIPEDSLKQVTVYLLEEEISFTLFKGIFLEKARNQLSVHLSKQQLTSLVTYLREIGIEDPTMDLTEVKVKGNIKTRVS